MGIESILKRANTTNRSTKDTTRKQKVATAQQEMIRLSRAKREKMIFVA